MKPTFSVAFRYIMICLIVLSFSLFVNSQEYYLPFSGGYSQSLEEAPLPQRSMSNLSQYGLSLSYEFQGAKVSETYVDNTAYQYIHISGFTKMAQVGAPALPVHNELIAMPPGARGKINILNTEFIEYSGYKIHPALKPARDTEGYPEPEFEIDMALYNTDAFFPENIVEIKQTYKSRGTPIALTQIVPVQFNPFTGVLRVYSKIEFGILYQGGGSFEQIAEHSTIHYTNLLKLNVLNSENIPDGTTVSIFGNTETGEKNYIIITHSQYLTQANQLADWKRQLGYSVEVVSASSWTAWDVKNVIHTRYNNWTPKPDFFVIIGDHDGSYAVPAEIHYTNDSPPEAFASDLYYACMDGGSDWHPDMAHGRISVSSVSEAQTVVDKIINYEKNPVNNASFYQNGLNCAQYQDDNNNGYAERRFCHTSEDIRDYLQNNQGYISERIYYTNTSANVTDLRYNNGYFSNGQLLPADLRSTSFNWNGGSSDITAAINAGKFYVFHRDHGYSGGSGWAHPYYTTSTMTSLSNGDLLPVVFSINCHTGEFQLSNCFAEKFIRMSGKGAVGVVAAAYYSSSGYNDGLSVGMIDAIWADPGLYPVFGTAGSGANYTIGVGNEIYTMGDVVNQGLYAMEQNVAWSSYRQYHYELFHWFGDPAMRIWTANPHNNIITASHSSTIDCAGSSFSISGSTPGALATLVYNNSLIGETTLDASGNGTITYTISSPGTQAILCVSKHNYKPYISTLTVTGNCAFPPAVISDVASGVSSNSAVANGQITNDFGFVVTESGFVYGTSPNPVIGDPNVTQLQTSPVVTMGSFSLNLSGLLFTTTYHYQAYAINANGTSYGGNQTLTTSYGAITLPHSESFNNTGFPDCWTQQTSGGATDRWSVSASNNAGGQANEMWAVCEAINPAVARLVSPPINTVGLSQLDVSFKHFFDDFGPGVTIKIQSSIDTINWTDESWSYTSGNGNIGPETVNNTITGNLNSPSAYLAFTIEGDLYQFDNWYIDDVSLTIGAIIQTIELNTGWNIMSFMVIPDDPNLLNILQPLVDSNELVKVINEAGGFIQYIPGIGWMNTIGNMANTEGYYIKVLNNTLFDAVGIPVTSPFNIPLNAGWNIMGYPLEQPQDALTALQPIINANELIKVINEAGGFIQYIPGVGWMNTIGNFEADEGYYIKVNNNTSLSLHPWQCGEPFTDPRDGQTYNTVLIGNQCWMTENLKIGTMINGSSNQTDNSTIEKYCYENNTSNCNTYGGLYQWDEMMQYTIQQGTKGICPNGWHLPTDEEWKVLEGTVDSQYGVGDPEWDGTVWRGYDAGNNLKSTSGWYSGGNGSDAYGFSALPGGYHYSYGNFNSIEEGALFWSSTEINSSRAWRRSLYYCYGEVRRYYYYKASGSSVRCLKY